MRPLINPELIFGFYLVIEAKFKKKNPTINMRIKQTARKSCTKSALNKNFGTGFAKKSTTPARAAIRVVNSRAKIVHDYVELEPPPRYQHKLGAKALQEIKMYQQATNFVFIKRLPLQRLVRSICQGLKVEMRFQVAALEALRVFNYLYCSFSLTFKLHCFRLHRRIS